MPESEERRRPERAGSHVAFESFLLFLVWSVVQHSMSIGIPVKLVHEAEGHIITIETKGGEIYRGHLVEAEDNMNCQMANITVTSRDGRISQLETCFIRGIFGD